MKISLFACFLLLPTLALADWPKVTSGQCMLEKSREAIPFKNLDPGRFFGVFAEGVSTEGFRIYLMENFGGHYYIYIQANENLGYALIPRAEKGPTWIRTGITIQRPSGTDWLSCDLNVE